MSARRGSQIYRVVPADSSRLVVVSLVWFNYGVRLSRGTVSRSAFVLGGSDSAEELTLAARQYWTGGKFAQFGQDDRIEVLLKGSWVVEEGPY
jgi:hypothetical protein